MYRPPTQGRQGSFTETITKQFSKNNTNDAEMYILADFNIDYFRIKKIHISSNEYSINVTRS